MGEVAKVWSLNVSACRQLGLASARRAYKFSAKRDDWPKARLQQFAANQEQVKASVSPGLRKMEARPIVDQ